METQELEEAGMLFESLGAKKTTPPEDQPVVQSMRSSSQGLPKNPTREDKKVRQQLARTGANVPLDGEEDLHRRATTSLRRSALAISDDHDLRPLHTRAAAHFLQH